MVFLPERESVLGEIEEAGARFFGVPLAGGFSLGGDEGGYLEGLGEIGDGGMGWEGGGVAAGERVGSGVEPEGWNPMFEGALISADGHELGAVGEIDERGCVALEDISESPLDVFDAWEWGREEDAVEGAGELFGLGKMAQVVFRGVLDGVGIKGEGFGIAANLNDPLWFKHEDREQVAKGARADEL